MYSNSQINPSENLSKTEAIISLLAYFDIFNHPLKVQDLERMKGFKTSECRQVMEELVKLEVCYEWNGYYGLNSAIKIQVESRQKAEQNAEKYWLKVKRSAQIIANFPFVRGVAISGSLSKGVMSNDGDIDFFIITEPNRLWLTRSLLILYKKIRLLNSRKYFCLNYFVDTQNIQIIDKNIFTAVEVSHLIVVYSENNIFNKFYDQNKWVHFYLNSPAPINVNAKVSDPFYSLNEAIKITSGKKRIEKFLNGKLGNILEIYTHKMTLNRWMKKFGHFNEEKFELTMRSTKGVSKHHPQDFQSKVLDTYLERFENAMSSINKRNPFL
ncbi:MAG: hypothetical protein RIR48_1299 [Bacteroidota bacterium]